MQNNKQIFFKSLTCGVFVIHLKLTDTDPNLNNNIPECISTMEYYAAIKYDVRFYMYIC